MPRNWWDSLLNRKSNPGVPGSGLEDHSLDTNLSFEQMEDRSAPSGLVVTNAGAATLVTILTGGNVQTSNATSEGAAAALATFTGGNGIIGFDSGIILSTGLAASVVGPWAAGNPADTANGTPGDPQLQAVLGLPTFDAAGVSFDFVPTSNTLVAQFVFGSDEYNEFVNTNFNDAFAFFLNGENIHLIPGSGRLLSVDGVNNGRNNDGVDAHSPQFFINNETGAAAGHLNTTMDGLTTVLTAVIPVTPGQSNHVKLVIADATDNTIDSNIFIRGGSFSTQQVNVYAPLRYEASSAPGFSQPILKGNLTVVNLGPIPLSGQLFLAFPDLPPGVTVLNATGSLNGVPFIKLPDGANLSLNQGKPLYVPIVLSNQQLQVLPTFYQGFIVSLSSRH